MKFEAAILFDQDPTTGALRVTTVYQGAEGFDANHPAHVICATLRAKMYEIADPLAPPTDLDAQQVEKILTAPNVSAH